MNTLELLWRAYPLEVITYGAIVGFCGLALAACLIGLFGSVREADELVDAD